MNILHRRHKQRKESGNASHLFVRVESSLLQLGVATGRVFRGTGRAGRAELVETLAIDDATGTNGRRERAHCDGHRCTAGSRRLHAAWVGLEGGESMGRTGRRTSLGQQVGGQVFTLVQLSSCRSTGLLSRRRCALRASY